MIVYVCDLVFVYVFLRLTVYVCVDVFLFEWPCLPLCVDVLVCAIV